MKAPVWVLRETVLALHEQLLAEFGGSGGIRDEGMLESTLGRPENLFHQGRPAIYDLAASYGFGLVKNHPFVNGNKRIGFAVAALFLEINGHRLQAPEAEAAIRTLALSDGEVKEAAYAVWLKENSRMK